MSQSATSAVSVIKAQDLKSGDILLIGHPFEYFEINRVDIFDDEDAVDIRGKAGGSFYRHSFSKSESVEIVDKELLVRRVLGIAS